MKIQLRTVLIWSLAAFMTLGALQTASARGKRGGKNRTAPKVIKSKPAIEYTGTIKSILTNTLPYQILVEGKSNSDQKGAPKGGTTFDVSGLCRIKGAGGASGSFSDLRVGQTVGISYIHGLGDSYTANVIDLNPPAETKATTKGAAAKKKNKK